MLRVSQTYQLKVRGFRETVLQFENNSTLDQFWFDTDNWGTQNMCILFSVVVLVIIILHFLFRKGANSCLKNQFDPMVFYMRGSLID